MTEDDGSRQKGTITERLDLLRRLTPKGVEFWRAREIMPVLGYHTWGNMRNAIERAQKAFSAFDQDPSLHFSETTKVEGSTSGPEGADFFLSRPACYITVMNGDSRKPEIAEGQQYFAVQARGMEKIQQLGSDLRRWDLRQRVTENTKILGSAAKNAGVTRYGLFHAAGIKAMYEMGLDEIKTMRGLGKSENWLDRMGSEELAANDFRITQAEAKLRREGIRGEQKAIDAHASVGREVRGLIKRVGNTAPEHLPVEPPIKAIEKLAKKISDE